MTRTDQQNKAEHKWFRDVANALNDAGYSVNDKQVIRMDIPFTDYVVKRFIFSKIAKAMYGNPKTSRLTKQQTSEVIEVMNEMLAENWHIHVPFPSREER